MAARFAATEQVDEAFAELKAHWDTLTCYTAYTPDEKVNRMVNIWNQYQCMVTFNLSRSASYFESGIGRGIGFRDSNQDILGFVHQAPLMARERILDLAATQLEDGGAYHQYQPYKKGNNEIGSNFNDDPLWLILSVSAYIKETVISAFLTSRCRSTMTRQRQNHFLSTCEGPCHVVNNLGPHGLPLIGRADWNDCLNLNCFLPP